MAKNNPIRYDSVQQSKIASKKKVFRRSVTVAKTFFVGKIRQKACSNNRWVDPETERIPQPVPDPHNRGHFICLPRKCLKDLYEDHSVSVINDGDTIKSFFSKYNVDEKHVIIYINHLKDINIRKHIRTREAQEQEARGGTDMQGL